MYIRANGALQRIGKLTTMLFLLVSSQIAIEVVTFALVYNKQRYWRIDECLDGLEDFKPFNFTAYKLILVMGMTAPAELAIHIYLCLYVYWNNKQV